MKTISITFYIKNHLVLPRVESDKPMLSEIALSRKGNGCWYLPSNFKKHDDRAPALLSTEEKQNYIDRVTKDILKAWEKVC